MPNQLFYENINKKFKDILDHPVPALLISEAKELAKLLENMEPGVNNDNFNASLNDCDITELIIRKVFESMGLKYIGHSIKNDYSYDIEMEYNTKRLKCECKCDAWHAVTNNIAIEESRIDKFTGKAIQSGIHVWDCFYVAFYFPQIKKLCIMKLTDLKALYAWAKENPETGHSKSGMGQDKRTTNFLLKYKHFEEVLEWPGNITIQL